MILETRRLLDRASRWLLSNRPQPLAVGAEINRFHDVVVRARARGPDLLRGAEREAVAKSADELVAAGVPVELARRVASLLDCYPLLDVIEVAELADRDSLDTERSPRETAELYYALSDHLNIDSMLTSISGAGAGQPLARAGPARAARRPVLVAAGDHPGRAAAERPRAPRRTRRSRTGSGSTPGARPVAGVAGGDPAGRPAGPGDTVGRHPAGAQYGPVVGVFVAEVRPRWSDMDAYGHVNHANTVTLLEEARVELLFSEAAGRAPTAWPAAWWSRGWSSTTTRRWWPTATRCGWR